MHGTCARCERHRRIKRRGLCDACYESPGVKDQYPRANHAECYRANCANCDKQRRIKWRGLCYLCYGDRSIRLRYPCQRKTERRHAICKNCDKRRRIHRRGLCTKCYFEPGIRERFPRKVSGPRPRAEKAPIAAKPRAVQRPRAEKAIRAPKHARVRKPRAVHGVRCRHCPTGKACRPRGLCTPCYDTPDIRDQYPTKGNKFGRRSEAASVTSVRPAESPTRALPRTEGKIAVMAERVRLRQSLFHPDDAKA